MLKVSLFALEVPAVAPRHLPPEKATVAVNCDVRNGNLVSRRAPLPEAVQPVLAGSADTLYHYNNLWFSWAGRINAVSSPIRQDPYDRLYITGDGVPRYARNDTASGGGVMPAVTRPLGVPAPTTAPVISYTQPGSDPDPLDNQTLYFLCTYITDLGEESAPSPVSDAVVLAEPDTDTLTITLPGSPTVNDVGIVSVRLYMTRTTDDSSDYYQVADYAVTTADVTITPNNVGTNFTLVTQNYDPPPAGMHSLIKMPGGFLVGATNMTLHPSEAYLPYAYQYANQLVTNAPVVAMRAFDSGAVVMTTEYPEILSGDTPESLYLQTVNLEQACVAPASAVTLGQGVIYASPDGLVLISASQARLLTDSILLPEQWAALNPATIHGYAWEGKYIGFYDETGGFIYDPGNNEIGWLDYYADAGYADIEQDKLYLLVDNQLCVFDGGAPLTKIWRSKLHQTPTGGYEFFRVVAAPGEDLTGTVLRVYADSDLLLTNTFEVDERDWNYLPGVLAERWQVEIETTATIEQLILGSNINELGLT